MDAHRPVDSHSMTGLRKALPLAVSGAALLALPSMASAASAASPLLNGNFDSGRLSPWVVTNQHGASASASIDTSTYVSGPDSANVNITKANSANPWYVEFHQYNLQLTPSTQYVVSFRAKADKARQIQAFIQQQGGSYSNFVTQNFNVTTSWQQFGMTMPARSSYGTTYQALRFALAQTTGHVWLDDVTLAPAGASASSASASTGSTTTSPATTTTSATTTTTSATTTTTSATTTTTTPVDTTPPSVPTGVSATAGDGQVALSWAASGDSGGAVAGYRVFRGGTQVAQVSGTSYTDSGLTDGTSYGYSVAAYDTAGNVSAQSAPVSATPQAASSGSGSGSSSAPACTIFVSPSGGGNGSTSSSPEALSSALSQVGPGSVACLEAGTYNESSTLWISRSGTPAAPITYRNYGGVALVQYTGGATSSGVLETSSASNWGGTHDVVINGLTIDGGNEAGIGIATIQGSHNVTVTNCVIRNTGATGIAFNAGDYLVATHNEIFHTGYRNGWSSGISLWYGGDSATYGGSTAWYDTNAGFHNVIVDNIISGAYDNSSNHSDGNAIIVDGSGSIPPVLIADNLVYENGGRGIEDNANSGDVWIVNNTAYADGLDLQVGGGQAPDYGAYSATNVHFVNDLSYGRKNGSGYTSAYIYNNTSSTISWAGDMGYNGSTQGLSSSVTSNASQYNYGDPLFTSTPTIPSGSSPWASATPPWSIGNAFTLQSGSAAIGGGTNPTTGMSGAEASSAQAYLATDLAGNPRGATPSVGAYQG